MKKLTLLLSGALSIGLLVTACAVPTIPITPETLAGCWEGEAFSYHAKVDITQADGDRMYTMNGEASGPNDFQYDINNIGFTYEEDGSLTPQNLPAEVSSVPVHLKVDGGVIKATVDGVPEFINIGLKRCATDNTNTTDTPAS